MHSEEMTLADHRRAAHSAPMLDAPREEALLRRIAERDDPAALAEVVAAHARLVVSMAGRFSRSGLSTAELVAEGNLGLVEAARRFDATKGARFSTYAAWWVRARIARFSMENRRIVGAPSTRNARKLFGSMRKTERSLRQELGRSPTHADIARATGTTEADVAMVEGALASRDVVLGVEDLGGVELGSHEPSPEQQLAEREEITRRARAVERAMRLLDAREREVVRRRLLEDEGETLAAIGQGLGLSRERVRQLEVRARGKLREALREVA
jgi:RNA polymerase sigma-32 factor